VGEGIPPLRRERGIAHLSRKRIKSLNRNITEVAVRRGELMEAHGRI